MKKRVLHVSAGGLPPGGVGSVIFSIVKQLYTQFDFHCVVFNREYEQEQEFEKYGKLHRIHCYPKKGKRDYLELLLRPFKLFFGILAICKNERIDIIHCHNQRDSWICLWAAKCAKVPVRIAHSHVTNSPQKTSHIERFYKHLSPYLINRTATFKIGCSQLACRHLFQSEDFLVIPNAIDLSRFCKTSRNDDEVTFIHVGRFNYAKNQEFVIKTFAEICNVYPNSKLLLVGYGDACEFQRLTNLISFYGINKQAHILPGDTVEVQLLYNQANYMIFPSRFEGFGIVLLEAQAMGIQCYVSENIQPEVDVGMLTFLNLSDGPKKWAEYILEDIRNGIRKTCDPALLSQFDEKVICQRYAVLYMSE